MDVEKKVQEIICEQLSVEESEVTPEASFVETLNADSLDIVELIMAFEEQFNIDIPDEEAEKLRTVSDAIKYINENADLSGEDGE
jgi:acyl carrier protein